MRIRLIILLVTLLSFNPSYSFVTVGAVGCDETNIITALNSGDSEIRLVKGNYTTNFSINNNVEIIGGYSSCAAASANIPPTDKTFIYASTTTLGPSVIKITLNNTIVKLSHLYITGARKEASVFNGGHGIEIVGTSGTVDINDSSIIDNHSDKGGGIHVSGNNSAQIKHVNIVDSVIFGNNAVGFSTGNGFGGGIYCAGSGSHVYINGETEISNNYAENGGGIAAENGCQVRVSSGIDVSTSSVKRGVMNNNAFINGGGVYLNNNARLDLDPTYTNGQYGTHISRTKPATIAFNTATLKGGGVYAEFNSYLTAKDALIHANSAVDGGGVYLTTGSNMDTSFSNYGCWSPGSCMVVSHNTATGNTPIGHGGAFYISNTERGSVFSNTLFYGNRSDSGTVMYAQGIAGQNDFFVAFFGSIINNNGDDGNGGFADFNAFQISNNTQLIFNHSTIVDNDLEDSTAVIRNTGSKVNIYNSIIHNNENIMKEFSAIQTTVSCVVVNEDSSISGNNIYVEDPGFINPNNQNYHLSPDSFAVDLCAFSPYAANNDFDSDNRGIDILSVVNIEGVYDAGADEYNDHEIVFNSGFE